MLKEYYKFFTDKRLLIVLSFFLAIEVLLQFGFWKPYLKKNSYAANVNRIVNHALAVKERYNPNVLILGTSVGFEGLSIPILQTNLRDKGFLIQQGSIPGSELIVQERVANTLIPKLENVKLVLHIMEPGLPWVDRTDLVPPTLSMLGELGNFYAIPLSKEREYELHFSDVTTLAFKSIAYRKDFQDLVLDLNERIKFWSRSRRNPNREVYDYDNPHEENISGYKLTTVTDCLKKTEPTNPNPIPEGSDFRHRKMVYETCALANTLKFEEGSTENTKRYFRRLNAIYRYLEKHNIRVINVFAPYSDVIREYSSEKRMNLWKSELQKIVPKNELLVIDLQDMLHGEKNGEYVFDLIHLNKKGKEAFTQKLSEELIRLSIKP